MPNKALALSLEIFYPGKNSDSSDGRARESSPRGARRLRWTDQFHKREKRLFGCGFALTWLFVAYKRRALNDRR